MAAQKGTTGSGMIVRRLRVGDEAVAREVVEVCKRASPSAHHIASFLANEGNYFYVAEVGGVPAGFSLAYELQRCDGERPMMFLYEIEILSQYRRQGIAKALVHELKATCQTEKCKKMFVITNESNAPAMNLYRSTGFTLSQTGEASFEYRI